MINTIHEAEHNVLGACLINENAILHVMDMLEPRMFSSEAHAEIFSAMLDLAHDSKPTDPVLVAQAVPKHRNLIGELVKSVANSSNAAHYADRVVGFWKRRELARIGREILTIADEDGDVNRAMTLLVNLAGGENGGFVAPKERLREVVKYIEERHEQDGGLIGHSTGLVDLDAVTSGWRAGCLYVIAGRPAMGKTAFALQSILPTAQAGLPVLVFSMEMPARELDLRLLSNLGGIPQDRIQSAKFDEEQWARFTAASARMNDLPIFIDDTPAQTLAALTARAKREALKRGQIGAIVVDYIGLMRGDGDNRVQEIGSISRGLKALAKDMNCPVIALSQLNRKCEERTDKRPMMSDLRDSGDVEQDADVVIMIYRDSVYNPDSPFAKNCIAELLVRKNRHGIVRDIRVADQLGYSRFANADYSMRQITNVVGLRKSGGFE